MTDLVESLPAYWYYDDQVFRCEQDHIFSKNWSFVAPLADLDSPGKYVTAEIAGQGIVIVRTPSDDLRGHLNLCRHRASPVCAERTGHAHQFTCPYHGWCYDLDGNLLQAPGFGDDLDKHEFGLVPVRVDAWNGLVFACLDPNCESLENWLGDIVDIAEGFPGVAEMEFDSMRSNLCNANWKNYSDNAAEGYHLSMIHPGLSGALVKPRTRIEPHENGKFVGFDVTYKEESGTGSHSGKGSPGYWIYKFPGLLIHFSMSGFNIEKVIPMDSRSAEMQRWFWFSPGVSGKQRNQVIEFSNQVMDEDMGICSKVQKNLEAGYYQTGMLSPQREPGTIFFQACVREHLAGHTDQPE